MIPVGWLAPSADCWDSNLIRLLLDGKLYKHDLDFRHCSGWPNTDDPVVVVCPGRYWAQHTDQINQSMKRFAAALFVVTSDEEGTFDIGKIVHDRARFWVQTPREGKDYGDARLFGVGFPPHFNDLPAEPPEKMVDVFLSAQRTHIRRVECFDALKPFGSTFIHPTSWFTEGMDKAEYAVTMTEAKVAPCPSGAVSPDSFRTFEALEAHCVPIADTVSPIDGVTDYWRRVFDDPPFPTIENYGDLPGYIEDALAGWPANANRVAAYWMRAKRHMAMALKTDLEALGALKPAV